MGDRNSTWITVVLITVIIMLVFLVFYGNRGKPPAEVETPQTEALKKAEPPKPAPAPEAPKK